MSDRRSAWTDSLVLRWNRVLVRGLPPSIADDRFAQIVSDIWEQRHAEFGSVARASRSILLRTLRGLPADLLWRHAALTTSRAAGAPAPRHRHGGMKMTKNYNSSTKPWVHLTDIEKPFDQTNGAVDFDSPDAHDAEDVESRMLARGVASNAANVGLTGGF